MYGSTGAGPAVVVVVVWWKVPGVPGTGGAGKGAAWAG